MSDGYTKLFSDIVDSSIWDESPETCKVWVTLLALSNADGLVRGSVGWLAAKSRVTVAVCEFSIKKFSAPDPKSRTPDNDGRRIEVLEDGWLILNYLIFRDRLSMNPIAVKTRERVRKHRERYHALRNAKSVTPAHSASASESASESKKGIAKGKKKVQEPPTIPTSLNTPEFLKAWAEWNQHRVEKKKPQTSLSCQKQLSFLESIGTQRAIAAINYSIEKGWEGIYESKDIGGQTSRRNSENPRNIGVCTAGPSIADQVALKIQRQNEKCG